MTDITRAYCNLETGSYVVDVSSLGRMLIMIRFCQAIASTVLYVISIAFTVTVRRYAGRPDRIVLRICAWIKLFSDNY